MDYQKQPMLEVDMPPKNAFQVAVKPRNRWKALVVWSCLILGCALLSLFCRSLPVGPSLTKLLNEGSIHCHGGDENSIDSILRETPLIDGHNDWAIWMRVFHQNSLQNVTAESSLDGQVDIPRLEQGRLGGQFWSVYVECPDEGANSTESAPDAFPNRIYWERVHQTIQQIDFMKRVFRKFPSHFKQALTADEVTQIHRQAPSKIASLLGIEGLHQIGNSPSILRQYYDLGVRYATLTHDCHNRYADAAAPETGAHGGLSAAGRALVHEMNRMGMAVDLAHASADTMRDALNVSRAPVMFSHSSAAAVCPHPRNVPDDVLDMLRENGGIAMVTFYPAYTRCSDPDAANLDDVVRHIQHIVGRIGVEHVGIGADFDGMAKGVRGLEDVSKYPDLIRELQRRDMSTSDIKKIMGLNVQRVLRAVEQTAATMANEAPLEDDRL